MKDKLKVHFLAEELRQPTNPIKIHLIGAGGTGSFVLSGLARLNEALIAHNHPGFMVFLWDDDKIEQANIGRQLFAVSEIGLYKSVALINRINRFFGTDWRAEARQFPRPESGANEDLIRAGIYISCVDNIASRFALAETLNQINANAHHRHRPRYWLDFGNSRDSGQVVLSMIGKVKQPDSKKFTTIERARFVTEEFEALLRQSDEPNTQSCSMVDSLKKQSLYINSTLANLGCNLLTTLLFEGLILYRGLLLNIKTGYTRPLPFS